MSQRNRPNRPAGPRGLAGPPPPRSWLERNVTLSASRHAVPLRGSSSVTTKTKKPLKRRRQRRRGTKNNNDDNDDDDDDEDSDDDDDDGDDVEHDLAVDHGNNTIYPPGWMPGTTFPPRGSLQDVTQRKLARKFSRYIAEEREQLGILPSWLKAGILALVAARGSTVNRDGLAMLFADGIWVCNPGIGKEEDIKDEVEEEKENVKVAERESWRWEDTGRGGEGMSHLYVGPSIGESLSWRALAELLGGKGLRRKAPTTTRSHVPERALQGDRAIPGEAATIPESWEDDEDDSGGLTEIDSPRAPVLPHLRHLTHLSLAWPPQTSGSGSGSSSRTPPLWRSLLSELVLASLTHVTHLDLARWPLPTLTPNALFAQVYQASTGIRVDYSGTGYYASIDDDGWNEAGALLRKLGRACVSLQWLGLEGCELWWTALLWESQMRRSRNSNEENHVRDLLGVGWPSFDEEERSRGGEIRAAMQNGPEVTTRAVNPVTEVGQMRNRNDEQEVTADSTRDDTIGWVSHFRSLRALRLTQGWMPCRPTPSTEKAAPVALGRWANHNLQGISVEVRQWTAARQISFEIEHTINRFRREKGIPMILVERDEERPTNGSAIFRAMG